MRGQQKVKKQQQQKNTKYSKNCKKKSIYKILKKKRCASGIKTAKRSSLQREVPKKNIGIEPVLRRKRIKTVK